MIVLHNVSQVLLNKEVSEIHDFVYDIGFVTLVRSLMLNFFRFIDNGNGNIFVTGYEILGPGQTLLAKWKCPGSYSQDCHTTQTNGIYLQ